MDTQFVRDRITQLRLKKGVSEYQMSYDLGHSRSYVYNISSGKSLPPMAEFLQICNYFDITPSQFFDESEENLRQLRRGAHRPQRPRGPSRRLRGDLAAQILTRLDGLIRAPRRNMLNPAGGGTKGSAALLY